MEFIVCLDLGFSWEISRAYSLLRRKASRLVKNYEGAYRLQLQKTVFTWRRRQAFPPKHPKIVTWLHGGTSENTEFFNFCFRFVMFNQSFSWESGVGVCATNASQLIFCNRHIRRRCGKQFSQSVW